MISPNALMASNTSSLTLAQMGISLRHPERFVAMHFFNPVPKMPLVEVVAGAKTSPSAIAKAVALCRRLGKTPLVVGDCPGFLVNRILLPGVNEVLLMREEGYPREQLEQALLQFGMPMRAFLLADEIGNDVSYKVSLSFEKAYGERMKPAKLFSLLAAKGLYGQKTGRGFYLHGGRKPIPNPEIEELVLSIGRTTPTHPPQDILPRFLYAMANEAARCLEEQIISRPDYLDLALILGIGFPPFRGGLLYYVDQVGVEKVTDTLRRFSDTLGPRFEPCSLLKSKAAKGKSFYNR